MNLNLNVNWIEVAIAIGFVLIVALLAVLYRSMSAKPGPSSLRREYSAEIESLRDVLKALQSKVEELTAESQDRAATTEAFSPQSALNMNKRSEALRIYGRGGDTSAVRATLGLPHADAVLLQKVHNMLSAPIARTPAPVRNAGVRFPRQILQ